MNNDFEHNQMRKAMNFLWKSRLWVGLIALFLGGVVGIERFHHFAFTTVLEIDQTPPNDLMAVVAGGKGRIRQALDLMAQGRSKRLMIIGAGSGVRLDQIVPEKEWPVGIARDLVRVENESNSTVENALKIREAVLAEHLRQVTVITSFYHAPRTRLLLNRLLPRWTQVYVVGVSSENFRQQEFWAHPLSIRIAIGESLKWLWCWAMVPQIL